MKTRKVTVVGGLTMDLLYEVPSLPGPSGIVESIKYQLTPGGKAFNIATALKRNGLEPV
jgi:sugar/nucleoside kinase (ribokinase family)